MKKWRKNVNYYKVLRISEDANLDEIKNSYKNLVKRYHPDIYQGNKIYAERKIKEINEAYDVLSSKENKKEYDEFLKETKFDNIKNYDPDHIKEVKNAGNSTTQNKENLKKEKKSFTVFIFEKVINSIKFIEDKMVGEDKINLCIIVLAIVAMALVYHLYNKLK